MDQGSVSIQTSLPATTLQTHSLGVVSYLNARPLYESLETSSQITLKSAVPSALIRMLDQNECDAALLPVVDYWRNRDRLALVSDGCIASDGQTLTVRIFSTLPPDRITRLHVDIDSHTSVILAQVIWRMMYNRVLQIVPWQPGNPGSLDDVEALLLIGDKVIRQTPLGFGFDVDLGAAWKYLTGLPFVFAAWYCATNFPARNELAARLSSARDAGVAEAQQIAEKYAATHGWPAKIAINYLCDILKFKLSDPMRAGMDRFFRAATEFGLLS